MIIKDSIKAIELTSQETNAVTESRSGVRYVRSLSAQRWLVNVEWVPMANNKARALFAQLAALGGQRGVVSIVPPIADQHPNASAYLSVNGTVALGSDAIPIIGSGELSEGGVINFAGHSKAYMVVNHSAGTLTIAPPLRKSVSYDQIIHQDPVIRCMPSGDDVRWQQKRVNSELNLDFEEVLD